MKTRRLLNIIFSLFMVTSMLLAATSQVSAKKPTPPAPKSPTHVHQGKVTPADRQAAAQRAAKARAALGPLSAQYALTPGVADYFGTTPNYAISPIPASVSIIGDGTGALYNVTVAGGVVTGFTMVSPGSGYTAAATTITVIGGGGTGGTGTILTQDANGGITSIGVGLPGSGYSNTYGIRKFVDTLPQLGVANDLGEMLSVAVPDITSYPGSDYYEITLEQFNWQFHTDLTKTPGTVSSTDTLVRGYVQTNVPTPVYDYLGPVIVAHAGRPVRIKFFNKLPTGTGGDLFIPVDTTVMGAGMTPTGTMYSQNRAVLHLHGGATPWISDGTPHQWTTPAGENTAYPEGVSVYNVPDMDSGSEPNGTLTYYYTNQQSARLMFYHDHSYGITRLNVYAGEAAGYVVRDNFENIMVNGKALDGTPAPLIGTGAAATATEVGGVVTSIAVTNPGVNYTSVPPITFTGGFGTGAAAVATMSGGKITNITVTNGGSGYTAAPTVVIANTSFTATAGTIPQTEIPLIIQDKTFVDPVDIQRSDPTWLTNWPANLGDLWYPHVYMPNQNPYNLMGVNNNGRWDWGPWFWPPWTVTNPALPNPYAGQSPEEGPVIPSTPNPSIVPEGYMDTPVINGTAYPVLNISPTAVRFRILNASNDRYMNLSLFCAASQAPGSMWTGYTLNDGKQGEVKMVQAVPGAGLPPTWPTDGRDGGVPDPLAAGPSWIVIGTEGGFLPQSAVVPPTPVGYEYNRRSITVLNVSNKALYLGPAERADVIVDFSQVNMTTCNRLILYNDAPAPMPAFDPRNDYYTGDPDQTSTGGAPSTQLGYGPNTRTLMQINLSGSASPAFNKTALDAALPLAFAGSQPAPIVPEPAFNKAMGYTAPLTNYARIQDTTFNFFNGPLTAINVLTGGQSYHPLTTSVSITGGNGVGAAASAVITPVNLTKLNLLTPGSGYTSTPTVNITGGGGAGAAGTATYTKTVKSVAVTNGGSGYTSAPAVSFSGGGGSGASATAVINTTTKKVTSIVVAAGNGGSGYTSAPTVIFTGGGGTGAKATASITGIVTSVTLTAPGAGYQTMPTVTITGGGGTGATASLSFTPNVITAIKITNPGANYTSAPTVTITDTTLPSGTGATASAAPISIGMGPKAIQELFDNDYGRMNATLGVELPNTNGTTQTTIPYGFIDPPTDMLGLSNPTSFIGQLGDGTQIWKITHNGVDSHPVHFHMFNIQLIDRVGWDGMVKPPLPFEIGWKDTVIMNPLEDVIVAIRPTPLSLPWQLPNSLRALDPAMPIGSTAQFSGIDPLNQPVTVVNQVINYGWEYVWHCHILGHEENDFMRPMPIAVAPADPSNLTAAGVTGKALINLSFKDNALNETGFQVKRATSLTGPWTLVTTLPGKAGVGGTVTYTDTTVKRTTQYYYQVIAINVVGSTQASGYSTAITGYPTLTASSNVVSIAVLSK